MSPREQLEEIEIEGRRRGGLGHPSVIDGRRRGVPVEAHLRERMASRKLLVPYVTAGITADWLSYLPAYVEAGADAIEIGLPFSDPILDGPVVQQASHRALQRGTTVRGVLDQLAGFESPVPLIAMTYANLVLNAGAASFCAALAAAGVRGLLVPDLPVDELDDLATEADVSGVDLSLLAAPSTSPARNALIAERTRGFLYGVTVMGTTGAQGRLGDAGIQLAGRLKRLTDRPVLLGFGISTPEQAVDGARAADGVVIGSGLMQLVLDGEPPAAVGARLADVRQALDTVFPVTPSSNPTFP